MIEGSSQSHKDCKRYARDVLNQKHDGPQIAFRLKASENGMVSLRS